MFTDKIMLNLGTLTFSFNLKVVCIKHIKNYLKKPRSNFFNLIIDFRFHQISNIFCFFLISIKNSKQKSSKIVSNPHK